MSFYFSSRFVPQRSSIPSSLQGNASSVNTTALGTPTANWPSSNCTISQFFNPQQLVFDITLCGGAFLSLFLSLCRSALIRPWDTEYAGNTQVFSETCTGVCYDDWVRGSGANYDNAYFEVQYVRVYGAPGVLTVVQGGARGRRVAALGLVLSALLGLVLVL